MGDTQIVLEEGELGVREDSLVSVMMKKQTSPCTQLSVREHTVPTLINSPGQSVSFPHASPALTSLYAAIVVAGRHPYVPRDVTRPFNSFRTPSVTHQFLSILQ